MDTSFPARVAVQACVAWDGTRPADTESSSRSGWPAPKCDYRTEARLSDEVQSPQGPLESPFFSDRAVLPCENLTIAEPLSTDQRCPRTSQLWGESAFSVKKCCCCCCCSGLRRLRRRWLRGGRWRGKDVMYSPGLASQRVARGSVAGSWQKCRTAERDLHLVFEVMR
jgi:hypothetical protein